MFGNTEVIHRDVWSYLRHNGLTPPALYKRPADSGRVARHSYEGPGRIHRDRLRTCVADDPLGAPDSWCYGLFTTAINPGSFLSASPRSTSCASFAHH